MNKTILCILLLAGAASCKQGSQQSAGLQMDAIARDYVKLGLEIGQHDGDFVDAYYGPDSLKPATKKDTIFPKEAFLARTAALSTQLATLAKASQTDTLSARAAWLQSQLRAFDRRIRIFSGEYAPFDTESEELFDATAPVHDEQHFKKLIARLDSLLPGKGDIPERFQKLAARFIIPKNKIDTVFKTAITEARRRTAAHYQLPAGESFTLEYVEDKPWSGYNWYQGNYKSLIQINVSQTIFIERAIDLACHEGYPGHHVYNASLEKNLFRDKGWVEMSLYPLFSPQSLIAEGSANYGISVAFPAGEQETYCRNVLLPLAGLDTAGAGIYFKALTLKSQLNYARNEAARGLLSGKMDEKETIRWFTNYCLLPAKGAADYTRFVKKYRSYVINYNYGQDLVKNYIESKGGAANAPEKRWQLFEELLSRQSKASDLINKK